MMTQSTKACGGFFFGMLLSCTVLAQSPEPTKAATPQAAATADTSAPAKNYDTTIYERLTTEKPSLYEQIGGRPVLEQIMKDSVVLFKKDPRIAKFFEETDSEVLVYHLTEQVCNLAGGGCEYLGRSMEESHKGMGVKDADFVALVEDFQIAVRKAGLTFEQENKLVALLAPMRPVIVNQ
ncbi:MAG: group 1 truncated hemoglobin [Moraxellaceae bacterium]